MKNNFIKYGTIIIKSIKIVAVHIVKITKFIIKFIAYIIIHLYYRWKLTLISIYLITTLVVNDLVIFSSNKILLYIIELVLFIGLIYLLIRFKKRKYTYWKIFRRANLTNGMGETPLFLKAYRKWFSFKIKNYIFNTNVINIKRWNEPDMKRNLEDGFKCTILGNITEIKSTKNRVLMQSISAKYKVPNVINWQDNLLSNKKFVISLGENIKGEKITVNLAKDYHVLIGGTTGSGKTVLLDNMLNQSYKKGASIYVADLKKTDFTYWNEIFKNDNTQATNRVVTNKFDLLEMLLYLQRIKQKREKMFSIAKCKNLESYNKKIEKFNNSSKNKNVLPLLNRIIFACDEITEIFIGSKDQVTKDIETILIELFTQGRSFGFSCLIATQRPDYEVLNGQIRSTINIRICGKGNANLSEVVLGKGNYDAHLLISKDEDNKGMFITDDDRIFRGYYIEESPILKKDIDEKQFNQLLSLNDSIDL